MYVLVLVVNIFCVQQNILHIYADHLLSVWAWKQPQLGEEKWLVCNRILCSASKIFDIAISVYIPKHHLFKCFIASYKCWEWAEAAWIQIFYFWRVWGNYMIGSKFSGRPLNGMTCHWLTPPPKKQTLWAQHLLSHSISSSRWRALVLDIS